MNSFSISNSFQGNCVLRIDHERQKCVFMQDGVTVCEHKGVKDGLELLQRAKGKNLDLTEHLKNHCGRCMLRIKTRGTDNLTEGWYLSEDPPEDEQAFYDEIFQFMKRTESIESKFQVVQKEVKETFDNLFKTEETEAPASSEENEPSSRRSRKPKEASTSFEETEASSVKHKPREVLTRQKEAMDEILTELMNEQEQSTVREQFEPGLSAQVLGELKNSRKKGKASLPHVPHKPQRPRPLVNNISNEVTEENVSAYEEVHVKEAETVFGVFNALTERKLEEDLPKLFAEKDPEIRRRITDLDKICKPKTPDDKNQDFDVRNTFNSSDRRGKRLDDYTKYLEDLNAKILTAYDLVHGFFNFNTSKDIENHGLWNEFKFSLVIDALQSFVSEASQFPLKLSAVTEGQMSAEDFMKYISDDPIGVKFTEFIRLYKHAPYYKSLVATNFFLANSIDNAEKQGYLDVNPLSSVKPRSAEEIEQAWQERSKLAQAKYSSGPGAAKLFSTLKSNQLVRLAMHTLLAIGKFAWTHKLKVSILVYLWTQGLTPVPEGAGLVSRLFHFIADVSISFCTLMSNATFATFWLSCVTENMVAHILNSNLINMFIPSVFSWYQPYFGALISKISGSKEELPRDIRAQQSWTEGYIKPAVKTLTVLSGYFLRYICPRTIASIIRTMIMSVCAVLQNGNLVLTLLEDVWTNPQEAFPKYSNLALKTTDDLGRYVVDITGKCFDEMKRLTGWTPPSIEPVAPTFRSFQVTANMEAMSNLIGFSQTQSIPELSCWEMFTTFVSATFEVSLEVFRVVASYLKNRFSYDVWASAAYVAKTIKYYTIDALGMFKDFAIDTFSQHWETAIFFGWLTEFMGGIYVFAARPYTPRWWKKEMAVYDKVFNKLSEQIVVGARMLEEEKQKKGK